MTETTAPATEATDATPGTTRPTPTELRQRRESLHVSRVALAELTGLPTSRCWAAEQDDKTVTDEHIALICAALDNVATNGLPPHLRPKQAAPKVSKPKPPTRADLIARLEQAGTILESAQSVKSVKDLRALIEQAQAIMSGVAETPVAGDDEAAVTSDDTTDDASDTVTATA